MMKIKEIDLHLFPYAQQKNADNDLDVSKKCRWLGRPYHR